MSENNSPLNMAQIKADLFIAKTAIDESKKRTPKGAKYIKGLAGYHLQQAAEKMIKLQIYSAGVQPDMRKIYKHPLNDLIAYAKSISVSLIIPKYVLQNQLVISSWEAEGRYDVHVTVKITQLEKCYAEVMQWHDTLEKKGYK